MRVEGQGRLNRADQPRHIVIAGAGIGGLTAALALADKNFQVTVLEKSPQLEAVGAGIQLSPNASRILIALGLGEALAKCGSTPAGISVMTARSGGDVVRIPLGDAVEARYGAPYWIVHRADLQAALLARVAQMPQIELRLGAAVEGVQDSAGSIAVACRSGEDSGQLEAAALIGADGIHSIIRRQVHPGATAAFSGKVAWRSLIEAGADSPALDCVLLWLAPEAHIVAYPVSGGRRINIVAITLGDATASHSRSTLPAAFDPARLPPQLRSIVLKATDWTGWPLHSVDAPLWRHGQIALLGDAAHAMMPFAAQGAAMAVEDAAVLAGALVTSPHDIPAALRSYALSRQTRLAQIRRTAAQTGRIYHMSGPMAFARDVSMKLLGGQRLLERQHWIYGWTP